MRFCLRFLQLLSLVLVLPVFVLMLISSLISAKNYESIPENYPPEIRFKKVYRLVSLFLYIKGVKVVIVNPENVPKKAVLVVANHKSNLDPLILIKAFGKTEGVPPLTFIAKIELQDTWLFKIMKLIDCVFIDRKNLRQMAASLEQQQQIIRQGTALCVFPEGTRVLSRQIGEFKSGALKVAYNAFVPIVPLTIVGSMGHMESKKRLQKAQVERDRGYKIQVIFNTPINPINFNQIDSQNVANNVWREISQTYAQYCQDW